MNRIQTIIKAVLILIVGLFVLYQGVKWTVFRNFVPQNKALMVINKFGDQLPAELIAVPKGEDHYKGVEEELLGPGRYFINPIEYDTKLVDLTTIPPGDPQRWRFDENGKIDDQSAQPMVGLVSSKQGKAPPPGTQVFVRIHPMLTRE